MSKSTATVPAISGDAGKAGDYVQHPPFASRKGRRRQVAVASILAQYFQRRGREVQCIDTDPVNNTLSQYKALRPQKIGSSP